MDPIILKAAFLSEVGLYRGFDDMMFKRLHEKRSELINVVCVHEKYKERHNYVTLYGSAALLGGGHDVTKFLEAF